MLLAIIDAGDFLHHLLTPHELSTEAEFFPGNEAKGRW